MQGVDKAGRHTTRAAAPSGGGPPSRPARRAAQVRAEWACAEKAPGQTTCEALTALAEAQGVGLLVVGSIGRKGDKGLDMLARARGGAARAGRGAAPAAAAPK